MSVSARSRDHTATSSVDAATQERQRRAQRGVSADETGVDPEGVLERLLDVATERVVSDLGEHGGTMAEASGGHRHVGGRATHRLAERAHVGERYVQLLGVEVDADASDGEEVEFGGCHRAGISGHRVRAAALPVRHHPPSVG